MIMIICVNNSYQNFTGSQCTYTRRHVSEIFCDHEKYHVFHSKTILIPTKRQNS